MDGEVCEALGIVSSGPDAFVFLHAEKQKHTGAKRSDHDMNDMIRCDLFAICLME